MGTKLIDKKRSFPDFFLSLCWKMMEADYEEPQESNLFKVIMATCEDIINEKNKRDWYWMKQIMLKSHVWLRRDGNFQYLYYKLLKLVEEESQKQVNILDEKIQKDANQNKQAWNDLIEFEVDKKKLVSLVDPKIGIRQDNVLSGI